jgi:hypothetical protein
MLSTFVKNETESGSIHNMSSNLFDGSKRLSFLDTNQANSEFSLANFDHRNSLLAVMEDQGDIKNLRNFSLKSEYENELNELKLVNRRKQAHRAYLMSTIEILENERKYVAWVNEAREKHATLNAHGHGEKSLEQSNFFTTKNAVKPDIFPADKVDNYDFLYNRVKTLQAYISEMRDVIHEETTIGAHLKSIHISLVDDIVD